MSSSDEALCDLSYKKLRVIPEEVQLNGCHIRSLDLSGNQGIQLHNSLRQFSQLRKLVLSYCELNVIPDEIFELTKLEELYCFRNNFFGGLPPIFGRLVHLKKLNLAACHLKTLPSNFENLQQLEKLDLSLNDFSDGLPGEIWKLRRLKQLYLRSCHLATLPDSICNLEQLEWLNLRYNKLQEYPKCTLRMKSLRVLDLASKEIIDNEWPTSIISRQAARLDRQSDSTNSGTGQTVEMNRHRTSLLNIKWQTSISTRQAARLDRQSDTTSRQTGQTGGRTRHRTVSWWRVYGLCTCCSTCNSDDESDVQFARNLRSPTVKSDRSKAIKTGKHYMTYPRQEGRLDSQSDSANRRTGLAVRIDRQQVRRGNCIKQLPIELAYTCLEILNMDGNPITEPPTEIWEQGIKAIKSFMQALGAGRALMHADTLNMIGETGGGKTSVAQSLVARSPCCTDEADRTQVLHQHQLAIDESLGHSVTINDFGGHEIYHSVIPIFLPANGLVILVFRLNDENAQDHVKKWLLTAIAKCKEVRVIIVGTHADRVASQRSDLEKQMRDWSSSILKSSIKEVTDHICHLDNRSFDEQVQNKLHCLGQLRQNLLKADIKVVAVSCLKTDEGQSDAGLSKLFNFVVNSLRSSQSLPLHWCQVMNAILNHDGFYITMKQVKDICEAHFTDADDSEARAIILRYLSKTSQIIWLENHEHLGDIVFHSPLKIINMCKCILHHDSSSLNDLQDNHLYAVKEYENGILQEAMMRMMLCAHIHSETQFVQRCTLFEDICDFMRTFNLISSAAPDGGDKKFIIPCKLTSSRPTEKLNELEIQGSTCLNRVLVQLSFIGSIMPMSFFETSLSSMLTVIDDNAVLTALWRDGLIVHRGGVCFIAERCGAIIQLSAYSGPHDASPWTLLRPVLKNLSVNVSCSWHGAPPHCAIVCPNCSPRIQPTESKPHLGLIKTDLMKLTTVSSRGTVKLTCENCHRAIPLSLCFPPENADTGNSSQREIEEFFKNDDTASLLHGNLRRMRPEFSKAILLEHVKSISEYLYSKDYLNRDEYQSIMRQCSDFNGRNALLAYVEANGDKAIRCLAEALRYYEKDELADMLCPLARAEQLDEQTLQFKRV